MKTWAVQAFFPELKPAHAAEQSIVVQACKMGTAVQRALEEIGKRGEISGKRITTARVTLRAL